MERRLQVAHVKMEGALVVASQVGGRDTLPPGPPGLGGDNGRNCVKPQGCAVEGHRAPFLRSATTKVTV